MQDTTVIKHYDIGFLQKVLISIFRTFQNLDELLQGVVELRVCRNGKGSLERRRVIDELDWEDTMLIGERTQLYSRVVAVEVVAIIDVVE